MRRRELLALMGGGVLGRPWNIRLPNHSSKGKKTPNLLVVFPDQMRAHALGFMKQDPVHTPVLDHFAQESLVLTQAVSNYPVCSPFRAMFMTGAYVTANGVWNNCTNLTEPYGCELRQTDRCWSDVLREAGYSLGYIGKWHLESPRAPYIDCANNRGSTKWNEWCPPARRHGFDYWYAYNTYDYHFRPLYWRTDAGREEFHYVDQWGPEHEADQAIAYLRNEGSHFRDPGKPFALVVSMNPPHTPYPMVPDQYKEPYAEMSDRELMNRKNVLPGSEGEQTALDSLRNYFAMCTGVDQQFGRILDVLKEQNLEEDTVVLFTSDHGNCLGSHNIPTKNVHYEESMRIPFLLRFPGRIRPRKDDLLISTPDFYPSLLGLMGLSDRIPSGVQGIDYSGLFESGQGKRPEEQLYFFATQGSPWLGRRGLRSSRYTFVVSREGGKKEAFILHDNMEDPFQLENIAGREPDRVRQLTERLWERLKFLGDPWIDFGGKRTNLDGEE